MEIPGHPSKPGTISGSNTPSEMLKKLKNSGHPQAEAVRLNGVDLAQDETFSSQGLTDGAVVEIVYGQTHHIDATHTVGLPNDFKHQTLDDAPPKVTRLCGC